MKLSRRLQIQIIWLAQKIRKHDGIYNSNLICEGVLVESLGWLDQDSNKMPPGRHYDTENVAWKLIKFAVDIYQRFTQYSDRLEWRYLRHTASHQRKQPQAEMQIEGLAYKCTRITPQNLSGRKIWTSLYTIRAQEFFFQVSFDSDWNSLDGKPAQEIKKHQ